ncbi:MAG: hypothetical protein JWM85_2648 [Acidimicrobiaceae bacterium]|nr:hypothetical protein [Acidimicrobiaceae bacterium]
MNHHYAGFLGFDVEHDARLIDIALRGADAMAGLYDPVARQIPVGRCLVEPGDSVWEADHVAAVDAIHTSLPVLWRAHRETKHARIARSPRRTWHVTSNGTSAGMDRPHNCVRTTP